MKNHLFPPLSLHSSSCTRARFPLSHAVWETSVKTNPFLTLRSQLLPYLLPEQWPCYLNFLHLEDNSRIRVSHLKHRGGTIPLSSRVPIRLHFPRHRPNLSNPNSLTVSLKPLVGEGEFQEAPAKLKGMLWSCFSKRHQDISSPCYHLSLKHFDSKPRHKTEEKGGKASNSFHIICWVSIVSSHWRMIWLGLHWGDFAFFTQIYAAISPWWAHLYPCLTVWELCVIFGTIITEGAALQARSFIKKTRTLVSYFSMFEIIFFLLWHLLSLQSSQNMWQSYQDLIVMGESWWGNWGMALAEYALLHRLVSEVGRHQLLTSLWAAIANISWEFSPWHASKWNPHSKVGLIPQNKYRYPQRSL